MAWKHVKDSKGNPAIQEFDDAGNPLGPPEPIEDTSRKSEGLGAKTPKQKTTIETNPNFSYKEAGNEYLKSIFPLYGAIDAAKNFSLEGLTKGAQGGVRPILTGIAAEATRSLGRKLPLGGGPLPFIAGALANYGVSKVQEQIPNISGEAPGSASISRSAKEALLDRVLGRTTEAAMTVAALPKGGIKTALIDKLGQAVPKYAAERQGLTDAIAYANRTGAPQGTWQGLGEGHVSELLSSGISTKSKVGIINKSVQAQEMEIADILKGSPLTTGTKPVSLGSSTYSIAKNVEAKVAQASQQMHKLEKQAWQHAEGIVDASPYNVTYNKELTTQKEISDAIASGKPIFQVMVNGKPVTMLKETQEIKGAIDIGEIAQPFAAKLQEKEMQPFQDPAMFFPTNAPMQDQLKRLKKLTDDVVNAMPDEATGRVLVPFENTKELRDSLKWTIDHNSGDAKLSEGARALRSLLSKAEEKSIGDDTIGWFPGSKFIVNDAKRITKERARRFGSNVEDRLVTGNDITRPDTINTDMESLLTEGIKNREHAERLIAASPHAADEVRLSIVQRGYDQAIDKQTGLIDGNKFFDYLFGDGHARGMIESNTIFTPDQRTRLRQVANYAKANKFNRSGMTGYQDARIGSGLISMGVGTARGLLTGNWPQGVAMGAGFALGIPGARDFAEKLILDKKGGQLLLKRLYPASSQQALSTTQQIIKHLALQSPGRAAQIYLMTEDGGIFPARATEDGKIAPDPSLDTSPQ